MVLIESRQDKSMDVREEIGMRVEAAIPRMSPRFAAWAREHLIDPRQIELHVSFEGNETTVVWLVTDHVGKNDASSRVVFDAEFGMFGLECSIVEPHRRSVLLGLCSDDFAETVLSM